MQEPGKESRNEKEKVTKCKEDSKGSGGLRGWDLRARGCGQRRGWEYSPVEGWRGERLRGGSGHGN